MRSGSTDLMAACATAGREGSFGGAPRVPGVTGVAFHAVFCCAAKAATTDSNTNMKIFRMNSSATKEFYSRRPRESVFRPSTSLEVDHRLILLEDLGGRDSRELTSVLIQLLNVIFHPADGAEFDLPAR